MAAMRVAGIPEANCSCLELPDKESYLAFAAVIAGVSERTRQLQPALVLSPAYEGGHPDHDVCAAAVAAIRRCGGTFEHREFPLYHSGPNGEMVTGEFVPLSGLGPDEVLRLSGEETEHKARMVACFSTQHAVLKQFGMKREIFRPAPDYDFTQPPHTGPLLYERWGWGISGEAWRHRVGETI